MRTLLDHLSDVGYDVDAIPEPLRGFMADAYPRRSIDDALTGSLIDDALAEADWGDHPDAFIIPFGATDDIARTLSARLFDGTAD